MDYFEEQRRRAREKEQRLSTEAQGMSTSDLLSALSWQTALAEHSAEIGEGNPSAVKGDVIRAELRKRGAL